MMIAINQFNDIIPVDPKAPKRSLMEHFGRKRGARMYRDTKDGKVLHVGYVVAGHWCELFESAAKCVN